MAGKYREQSSEITLANRLKLILPETIFNAIPGAVTATLLALGSPVMAVTCLAAMTGVSVVSAVSLMGAYGASTVAIATVLGGAAATAVTTTTGALIMGAVAATGAGTLVWSIQRARPMKNILVGTAIGAALTFAALPDKPQEPASISTVKAETPATSLRHNFNVLETVSTVKTNTPAQKPRALQERTLQLF